MCIALPLCERTDDGKVYVWGDGRSGQLGLGDSCKKVDEPTLLPLQSRALKVWCGPLQTSVFTGTPIHTKPPERCQLQPTMVFGVLTMYRMNATRRPSPSYALLNNQHVSRLNSIEFDRYRIEGVPHVWYRSHGARVFATSCRRIARIGYLLGRLLSDRDRLRHRTGSSCRWISLADPSTRALCTEAVCRLSVNEEARA